MKHAFALSAAAAIGIACGAFAGPKSVTVDIGGLSSYEFQGDPLNDTVTISGLTGATIVSIDYDVDYAPVGASWSEETVYSLYDGVGTGGPFVLDNSSGSFLYAGSTTDTLPLVSTGNHDITDYVMTTDALTIELHEWSFNDNVGSSDADYNAGSSLTINYTTPEQVTPDVIFGTGNDNGSFTIVCEDSVELGMRGKLRFDAMGFPQNVFNSNGDGTYTFNTGSGGGPAGRSEWTMEWTVNTDYDDSSGLKLDDLTYEIGMDSDPGAGTNFLVFNPINPGFAIPWVPPSPPVPAWDHAMGDNTTPNGGGVSTTDPVTYLANIAAFNVAQQSWQPTFFLERIPASPADTGAPVTWDPDQPGSYDFYLKAFDSSGAEVAQTAITIIAVDGVTLSLEADPCQTDVDPVKAGIQVAVDLWLRNPDGDEVTGWAAFLDFDPSLMYEGLCSSYGPGPFTTHVQPIATADMVVMPPGQLPNQLWLDGSTFPSMVGTTDDELLATLVFTIGGTCMPTGSPAVSFDLMSAFPSEASFGGVPYFTNLLDSGAIVVDDGDPPMITCPADITQPADAGVGDGCVGAVVTWADPMASDSCMGVGASVVCTPSSGSFFPIGTTTVTCVATDDCGNTESCTFDVTVTATNLICVDIQLDGVSPTRCIHFELDDCMVPMLDFPLTFDASGSFVGEIEVPCGTYTTICAKDEQHTQWANADLQLSMDGTKWELGPSTTMLNLLAGDTDNDGDVDINDVTLLLAQFGMAEPFGSCPWTLTSLRGADFDNNGAVGTSDYVVLTPQWLTTSECDPCPVPFMAAKPEGKPVPRMSIPTTQLDWHVAQKADLNKDGMVDHRDVRAFELREGLPDTLSTSMLLGDLQYRRDQQRKRGR